MQRGFHHGLLAKLRLKPSSPVGSASLAGISQGPRYAGARHLRSPWKTCFKCHDLALRRCLAPVRALAQPPAETDDAQAPRTPIPPVTDADVEAAFPDLTTRPMDDDRLHSFVRLDRLEGVDGGRVRWDADGWVGGDRNRLWFRSEGDGDATGLADAEAHLLFGRAVARWWEVVVGLRQDVRPGPARSWLAVGIQGLAPYWFEVEATAYLGEAGRTAARVEAEYELLLTNRLIAAPRLELNLSGRDDPTRGTGAGLSHLDGGIRLRYEIRREIAPYVGMVWRTTFGETTRLAAPGEPRGERRLVAGVRLWF